MHWHTCLYIRFLTAKFSKTARIFNHKVQHEFSDWHLNICRVNLLDRKKTFCYDIKKKMTEKFLVPFTKFKTCAVRNLKVSSPWLQNSLLHEIKTVDNWNSMKRTWIVLIYIHILLWWVWCFVKFSDVEMKRLLCYNVCWLIILCCFSGWLFLYWVVQWLSLRSTSLQEWRDISVSPTTMSVMTSSS